MADMDYIVRQMGGIVSKLSKNCDRLPNGILLFASQCTWGVPWTTRPQLDTVKMSTPRHIAIYADVHRQHGIGDAHSHEAEESKETATLAEAQMPEEADAAGDCAHGGRRGYTDRAECAA